MRHEKKLKTAALHELAKAQQHHLQLLEKELHSLQKEIGQVRKMTEYLALPEEMVLGEQLTFTGTVAELADLLAPLLCSGKLRVNGHRNTEGIARVLHEAIHISTDNRQSAPASFRTLSNNIRRVTEPL